MTHPTWLGDISHLDEFDPTISSDHASELRQYFRIGGVEAFGKSTVAGMLKRAEVFSCGTKPCLRCGGHIPIDQDDPLPEKLGCGFVPSNSERNRLVTAKQAEFLALLDIEVAESIPMAADMPCPACGCRGWVESRRHPTGPITARPTGSSVKREPAADGMDIDLQILAICGRRLDRATALLPLALPTLAAQYEPGGGSLVALWHLVPAGKTWLRKNKTGTTPLAFFLGAKIAQEKNRDPKVTKVIEACNEQANGLIRAAGMAWNAAIFIEWQEAFA